jgi:Ca2+-binding EF-hand superfamily protein
VANLLQELDEDGSGTIDKKEFSEMLEKYAEDENFN